MGLFALYSVLWQAIAGCALFAYNPRLPYAVGTLLSLAVVFLALVLVHCQARNFG